MREATSRDVERKRHRVESLLINGHRAPITKTYSRPTGPNCSDCGRLRLIQEPARLENSIVSLKPEIDRSHRHRQA